MSFLRHGEIFPSDGGASPAANAPAHRVVHRVDEFPAGYSSAGWSPPEPASASPAVYEYAVIPSCRSRSFHRTVNCVLPVCVSRGGKRKKTQMRKTWITEWQQRYEEAGDDIEKRYGVYLAWVIDNGLFETYQNEDGDSFRVMDLFNRVVLFGDVSTRVH